jgi:hypothetical protein
MNGTYVQPPCEQGGFFFAFTVIAAFGMVTDGCAGNRCAFNINFSENVEPGRNFARLSRKYTFTMTSPAFVFVGKVKFFSFAERNFLRLTGYNPVVVKRGPGKEEGRLA